MKAPRLWPVSQDGARDPPAPPERHSQIPGAGGGAGQRKYWLSQASPGDLSRQQPGWAGSEGLRRASEVLPRVREREPLGYTHQL